MNTLDILIVVILMYCLTMGLFRGLFRELSSIAGVLAGFYAAYTYYNYLTAYLSKWISDTGYLNILSFLIIFISIFVIIGILGAIIKYLLKIITFGWLDRVAGGVFGLIKGTLIVSVLLMTFTAFLPKGAPIIRNSMLAPRVILLSEKMSEVIPKDMKRIFSAKIEHFKKAWKTKS
jgi:membrane protein required for colicin V production